MRATALERRFQLTLQIAIYLLGFWAPWERYGGLSFGGSTVWTALPSLLFRQHWIGFSVAARLLLILATVLAILAAVLRIWAASAGPSGTQATLRPEGRVAAIGTYRHTGDFLYWGTIFHVVALSLLMPPSGAVLAVLVIAGMQLRLRGWQEQRPRAPQTQEQSEEAALLSESAPIGKSGLSAGRYRGNWWAGAMSQIAYVATAGGFLVEGESYNGTLILRWVLIGVGLQLIWEAVTQRSPLRPAESGSR